MRAVTSFVCGGFLFCIKARYKWCQQHILTIIMRLLLGYFEITFILGVLGMAVQVFLSVRKSVLWGFIFPVLAFTQVICWSGNPIPEGQKPTMTALDTLLWAGLIVV